MPIVPWLDLRSVPDPRLAEPDGLVAVSGRMEPEWLLAAYRHGLFPWSSKPVINWWSPDPRAIFDLETFRTHRSVERSVRRGAWRLSIDEAFDRVMARCAERVAGRRSTWITKDFIAAYGALHRMGHAHSVEVWSGAELIGGLYGVSIGAFFGGESMFHRVTDASKAALGFLVERARAGGFALIDAQVPNDHLMNVGASLIPRDEFLRRLGDAQRKTASLTTA